jgi:predicted GH43/DUF377 family glycosyl hydrolase
LTIAWRKLGRVYCALGEFPWAISHAYCPTPVLLDGGRRVRVLCAFLDAARVGRCGWVDVDSRRPDHVLAVSERPVLDVGQPGTFDEHGVTPLSVVLLADGRLRLYYAGWQRGVDVRYSLFTGVAESRNDGDSFTRVSEAPVLDRSDGELHVRTGGLVLPDGEGWQMWYAGGTGWLGSGVEARPRYSLRHLRSPDGLDWPRAGRVCLEPREDELGFGRPGILRRDETLCMWYGRRALSGAYELGYAISKDGLNWERRDDQANLERGSPGTWDSEMVGLSGLLETPYGTYLFYNGNDYGATGFGVATAEEL